MTKQVFLFAALIAAATIGLLNAKQVEQEPIANPIVFTLPPVPQQLTETKVTDYTFEFIPNPAETNAVVEAPVEIVDYTFVFPLHQAE